MEFDELLITTGVDALVKLVREKQKVELKEISSDLNIPEETIEEWARVLEEEGILRIEYRLTRIYLVWIKPSDEQIENEREAIYEEKKELVTLIEETKGRVYSEVKDLRELENSFYDFYDRTQKQLDQLEKAISTVPAARIISEGKTTKRETKLSELIDQLDQIRKQIDETKNELGRVEVEKGKGAASESIGNISKIAEELIELKGELEAIRKKAAQAPLTAEVKIPTTTELKKKLESIKKEFNESRAKVAKLREDMRSLIESSQILKEVQSSLQEQEGIVNNFRIEMEEISASSEKLAKRVENLRQTIGATNDLVERFGETIRVSKGVLTRFPNQQKINSEIEQIRNIEEEVEKKVDALQKIFDFVSGNQGTQMEFDELEGKIEDKIFQVKSEIENLSSTLEEEKSTYLAFQKIRERVTNTLQTYQKQIELIQKQVESIKVEAETEKESIKESTEKIKETVKQSDIEYISKISQEIGDKKKIMDEIKQSLQDMNEISDNLNKRITLLAQEAKLFELRTGQSEGDKTAKKEREGEKGASTILEDKNKEAEIRKQIALTEQEEAEFKRKREELKDLIKKLWENQE